VTFLFIIMANVCPYCQSNTEGSLGLDSSTPTNIGREATDMANLSFLSFAPSLNDAGIAQISSTRALHTCVLFFSGSLVCFGSNQNGAIGLASTTDHRGDQPGEMSTLVPIMFRPTITFPIVQVATGAMFSCGT
jgi:hypothetical protein